MLKDDRPHYITILISKNTGGKNRKLKTKEIATKCAISPQMGVCAHKSS